MSTLKTNNVQVGQSVTATNNFTLYQPSSPDGTVRLGVGNSGATTADVFTANSSGVFLVGTTSSTVGGQSTKFGVVGSNNATVAIDCTASAGASGVHIRRSVSNGEVMTFDSGTTRVGNIAITGSATSYNTSSDYRLKEDIQPMSDALAKVAALRPVTYKWKLDGSAGQGFIAHELQEVVPGCVTGEKDAVDAAGKPNYQSIDTSFLVATLTAAIQEQQALITSLIARIVALEGAQP